jgi:xanthine dehydrogenase accessory factor
VPYVALVASPKRGAAVRAALDIADELKDRLHTPAGLDIGARTPEEVAISILAEVIAEHHMPPVRAAALATATDPVCGMEMVVSGSTPSLDVDGGTVYFCCAGCRDAYAVEHGVTS